MLAALLIAAAATLLPTALYVTIAWWLDRYEREPWWVLGLTFVWGAIPAVVIAAILELIVAIPLAARIDVQTAEPLFPISLLVITVVAPIVEESLKAVPLLAVYLLFRHEFDGLMDGLVYGALVGFGFALSENFIYAIGAYGAAGMQAMLVTLFLRCILFGLMHALWSATFGLGLGIARHARSPAVRLAAPIAGLAAGMALHAAHNFSATRGGLYLVPMFGLYALGCAAWLALVFAAGRREARWIAEELAEEVAGGRLAPEHAAAAGRYRSRVAARARGLVERGYGHYHLLGHVYATAAELAFKKRHVRLAGADGRLVGQIDVLRSELAAAQARL